MVHPTEPEGRSDGSGGEFLTFHEQGRLWQIPVDGGPPQALTRGPESDWQHRWSLDGRYIYVHGARERAGTVWRYRVEDGVEEPLTDLSGRRGRLGDLALATDERYVYFTWEDDIGDIWVMDVVTDEDQ